MDEKHWLQAFIEKNIWSILALLVGFSFFYASINSRVEANEEHLITLNTRVEGLQVLVERVIVLEERENSIIEDIGEIKSDIKEIKQTLSIHAN